MSATQRRLVATLDACSGRVIFRQAATIRIPTLRRFYEQVCRWHMPQRGILIIDRGETTPPPVCTGLLNQDLALLSFSAPETDISKVAVEKPNKIANMSLAL